MAMRSQLRLYRGPRRIPWYNHPSQSFSCEQGMSGCNGPHRPPSGTAPVAPGKPLQYQRYLCTCTLLRCRLCSVLCKHAIRSSVVSYRYILSYLPNMPLIIDINKDTIPTTIINTSALPNSASRFTAPPVKNTTSEINAMQNRKVNKHPLTMATLVV